MPIMKSVSIVRYSLERRELANWAPLTHHGWDLQAITPFSRNPTYEQGGTGIRVSHVACLEPAVPRLSRPLSRVAPALTRRFVGLGHYLDTEQVCSVMETYAPSSVQAISLRDQGRCGPVIVTCAENVPFLYERTPLDARNKAIVRGRADHFMAMTPAAADALHVEGADPDKVSIVPYGVDVDAFKPGARDEAIRQSWGVSDDQIVLLYAGRLIPEKGVVELLQAFAAAREAANELVLVIVGKGGDEARIQRVIAQLGLEGSVRTQQWISPDDLVGVYQSADVVVLPSLSAPYWQEQLGYVLLEAMACGKPIVSTRSGSIPWVVGDAALLTTPYDVQDLARALVALGQDDSLRAALSREGRSRAEGVFSTTQVAEQLNVLLANLL